MLENSDAREGSKSALPTKMEATAVGEPFFRVKSFAPFCPTIAKILKTVLAPLVLLFLKGKGGFSFGDKNADQATALTPKA